MHGFGENMVVALKSIIGGSIMYIVFLLSFRMISQHPSIAFLQIALSPLSAPVSYASVSLLYYMLLGMISTRGTLSNLHDILYHI